VHRGNGQLHVVPAQLVGRQGVEERGRPPGADHGMQVLARRGPVRSRAADGPHEGPRSVGDPVHLAAPLDLVLLLPPALRQVPVQLPDGQDTTLHANRDADAAAVCM
jgi:hypothetical protein